MEGSSSSGLYSGSSGSDAYSSNGKLYQSRDSLKRDFNDDLNAKRIFIEDVEPHDSLVFKRLNLARVDNEWVHKCHAAMASDRKIGKALKVLRTLTAKGKHKQELLMYDQLDIIFEFILKHYDKSSKQEGPVRRRYRAQKKSLQDGTYTLVILPGRPDYTVSDIQNAPRWRDQDAWGEVKVDEKLHNDDKQLTNAGVQCADYARHLISSNPAMVASVGFFIRRRELCVAIVDRGGIMISPSVKLDSKSSIRVIVTIARYMTKNELGMDPSSYELKHEESIPLIGGDLPPRTATSFPQYLQIITEEDKEAQFWITTGSLLFSSVSLLGRGTRVWRARKLDVKGLRDHPRPESVDQLYAALTAEPPIAEATASSSDAVLKDMWRKPGRDSESFLYQSLVELCKERKCKPHPAIAKWVSGSDVYAVRQPRGGSVGQKYKVTVNNLRVDEAFHVPESYDSIFHRLALETVGRPLWMYVNDEELIKGMKDALEGLIWLQSLDIVHRDVSPGNIVLAERTQKEGPFGYIIDLEHAKFKEPPRGKTAKTNVHQRGAPMSGTAPFMASEVLEASLQDAVTDLDQTADHDAESFAYVLSYVVLKRCATFALKGDAHGLSPKSKNDEVFKHLMESYTLIFGATSQRALLNNRHGGQTHFAWLTTAVGSDLDTVRNWIDKYGPGDPLRRIMVKLHTAQSHQHGLYVQELGLYRPGNNTAPKPSLTPWTTFAALKTLLDEALTEDFSEQQDMWVDDEGDAYELEQGLGQLLQEDENKAREAEAEAEGVAEGAEAEAEEDDEEAVEDEQEQEQDQGEYEGDDAWDEGLGKGNDVGDEDEAESDDDRKKVVSQDSDDVLLLTSRSAYRF